MAFVWHGVDVLSVVVSVLWCTAMAVAPAKRVCVSLFVVCVCQTAATKGRNLTELCDH